MKSRTHINIISAAETRQFLSEKAEMGGSITIVMLTSSSAFATKNVVVYGRKGMLI